MCFSSEVLVDRLGVCFYLVPKLVERFEGGFATDGSEVGSLEKVFFVNLYFSSWWITALTNYLAML